MTGLLWLSYGIGFLTGFCLGTLIKVSIWHAILRKKVKR